MSHVILIMGPSLILLHLSAKDVLLIIFIQPRTKTVNNVKDNLILIKSWEFALFALRELNSINIPYSAKSAQTILTTT